MSSPTPRHRVVVTGASSFIGYHLASAFAEEGHEVTATHSRPRRDYDGIQETRLSRLHRGVAVSALDICDAHAVERMVADRKPSLWVHHAGFATDYASVSYDLAEGHRINVLALDGLYAALAGTGCAVIVTGSSAEYRDGDAADQETDACWPSMPYGLCKLSETVRARQLADVFSVSTRVARVYIPFGPLDHPEKLLAYVVNCLGEGTPADLSPCTQKRDFIGVSDLTDGYLRLARDTVRGGFDIFNLSCGRAVPLRELLEELADALGADRGLLKFGAREMREGEPAISFGANDKARSVLGWNPSPLADAVRRDLLS